MKKKKWKFRTFACHSHSNYDRRSSLQKHLFYKQSYSFNLQTVISNAYPHLTFQRMPSATFWGPCDLEGVTMRSMTMEAAFLETFGVHWYVNINYSFLASFFHFFFSALPINSATSIGLCEVKQLRWWTSSSFRQYGRWKWRYVNDLIVRRP